jgi:predicted O-methyltransferase YrrM
VAANPSHELDPLNLLPTGHERAMLLPSERLLLYALVLAFQPLRVLEIGFCQGGSASIMLGALQRRKSARLVSIGPCPEVPVNLVNHPQFKCVAGRSPDAIAEAVGLLGGSLDFCFIDADHSENAVFQDSTAIVAHLEPGGYILYHDCYYPPVAHGITRFVAKHREFMDAGIIGRFGRHIGGSHWGGLRLISRSADLEECEPRSSSAKLEVDQ